MQELFFNLLTGEWAFNYNGKMFSWAGSRADARRAQGIALEIISCEALTHTAPGLAPAQTLLSFDTPFRTAVSDG